MPASSPPGRAMSDLDVLERLCAERAREVQACRHPAGVVAGAGHGFPRPTSASIADAIAITAHRGEAREPRRPGTPRRERASIASANASSTGAMKGSTRRRRRCRAAEAETRRGDQISPVFAASWCATRTSVASRSRSRRDAGRHVDPFAGGKQAPHPLGCAAHLPLVGVERRCGEQRPGAAPDPAREDAGGVVRAVRECVAALVAVGLQRDVLSTRSRPAGRRATPRSPARPRAPRTAAARDSASTSRRIDRMSGS